MPPDAARTCNFQHPDGPEALIEALLGCLETNKHMIIETNLLLYESNDMQVGIDQELLVAAAPLLRSMIQLDTRGGYIAQPPLVSALNRMLDHDGTAKARLFGLNAAEAIGADELIQKICYRIRVMLAHIRIVHDTVTGPRKSIAGHPLEAILQLIRAPEKKASRKSKRQRRTGGGQNPFVCFRTDESIDSDEVLVLF